MVSEFSAAQPLAPTTNPTLNTLSDFNASQLELDKFSQLAEQWWEVNGPFKPLHQLNPLRVEFVKTHASDLQGKKLLDIGCGGGIFSEGLAREGAYVTGIDLAEAVIEAARLHQEIHSPELKLEYRLQSSTDLALELPGHFDIVTCMEMLEHVPDPSQTIRECAQLTKPGGWIFFSTLNRTTLAYLFGIIAAEYILKMLPRGTHDYQLFIKPSELAQAAREAGLELQVLKGIHYTPWGGFKWTQDTSVNYFMAFTKPL
ncbi:MAG: bifunctional 2-polyprenyl-6-hydroxyphenol methylase/3-demethylubiquinol 3-O-methyltransferase UbiG [Pseudomonadota bacterium]